MCCKILYSIVLSVNKAFADRTLRLYFNLQEKISSFFIMIYFTLLESVVRLI